MTNYILIAMFMQHPTDAGWQTMRIEKPYHSVTACYADGHAWHVETIQRNLAVGKWPHSGVTMTWQCVHAK